MAQINKPTEHFNTKLYSGNGSTNAITGVGFKPDLTWIKARSGTYSNENHNIYDSTRGVTKYLIPNGSSPSSTDANSLTAFGTDGFTLGVRGDINGASTEYASWNWKANGGTTSSNTDGSITSTVQANTTAGFSIVSYTGNATAGATVGHGLGAVPKMILFKNLDSSGASAEHWLVYHGEVGNTHGLYFNLTNAEDASAAFFNNTSPTNSVFTLGNGDKPNKNGESQIAYCFAEKKGFSKFGFYRGNGNANGPFIYTGFKPAFIIIKQTNTTHNWAISDNKRLNNSGNQDGGNGNYVPHMLASNRSDGESYYGGGSGNQQDFLSNGFKIRATGGYANTSAGNYVYMAFAEQPLVGTNNIPSTAR